MNLTWAKTFWSQQGKDCIVRTVPPSGQSRPVSTQNTRSAPWAQLGLLDGALWTMPALPEPAHLTPTPACQQAGTGGGAALVHREHGEQARAAWTQVQQQPPCRTR